MPLRRTKRSDGHQRPRWKDGSHAKVENTDAEQSRCDGLAFELNFLSEPLKRVRLMLGPNHERNVSTRDRPARTGADARIEESGAIGELCLALRPYGRRFKLRFQYRRQGVGRTSPVRRIGSTLRLVVAGFDPASPGGRQAKQCHQKSHKVGRTHHRNRNAEVIAGIGIHDIRDRAIKFQAVRVYQACEDPVVDESAAVVSPITCELAAIALHAGSSRPSRRRRANGSSESPARPSPLFRSLQRAVKSLQHVLPRPFAERRARAP